MPRGLIRAVMAVAVMGLFVASDLGTSDFGFASGVMAGGTVRLAGHVLPALARAQRVAESAGSANAPITLTVVLRRSDEAGFERYLSDVYNPRSPKFHRFLTPVGVSNRFGPSQASYDAVLTYLEQGGFHLVEGSANRVTITISGTRRIAEDLFKVRLATYRIGKRIFYANDRDPALPAALAPSVQAVVGLSNLAQPARAPITNSTPNQPGASPVSQPCVKPTTISGVETVIGCACFDDVAGFLSDVSVGVTLASGEASSELDAFSAGLGALCAAQTLDYVAMVAGNVGNPDAVPRKPSRLADPPATLPGAGQKIGLLEFDNFHASDVQNFLNLIGSPSSINQLSEIDVAGGAGVPGSGESEVLLDIDTVMNLAPGAEVVVYDGPFSGRGSFQAMFNAMINGGVNVISNSWAYCEDQTDTADLSSLETVLANAAAAGITVVTGSGDNGSTCLDGSPNTVAVPADAPSITAVGGTSSTVDVAGSYGGESWWDGTNNTPPTGQGGFGVSTFFTRPAYQNGLNPLANRSVPDVTAPADPLNGLMICQADDGGCPSGLLWGGTSMAAPIVAAFVAGMNQAMGYNLGFLNPLIYPLSNTTAFHSAASMHSDFTHVGLGSFNVDELRRLLSGAATEAVNTSSSLVLETPPIQVADGVGIAGVAVVLRDGNLYEVSGQHVSLTANNGSHATITTLNSTTDTTGAARFTVTDTVPETVTLTASTAAGNLAQTATVNFVSPPAAAGSISASPTTVTANGTSTTTITVKLVDAHGNPSPNKLVGLSQGDGASQISGTSGATDSTGTVNFTATDQVTQNVTYTATDVTDGNLPIPGSATVDFTNGPISPPCNIGLGTAGAGFAVSTFASGFPFGTAPNGVPCNGPIGLAFSAAGNLLVGDVINQNLYKFPPQGGAAGPATEVGATGLSLVTGLAFTADGRLYAGDQRTGRVVELDPSTGGVLRTVANVDCPTGLAVDPLSGDLFFSDPCYGGGIFRISNFSSGTGTVTLYNNLAPYDGISFAPDGTLYAAAGGNVYSISGTNTTNPGTATQIASVPTADGIAVGPNASNPSQPTLFVNANNGTITTVDTSTAPPTLTTVYSGGSRGDFVTVGPDGCLYATQTDRIIRLSKADGTCPLLATVNQSPLIALTPPIVTQSPVQGSPETFTATLKNVTDVSGVPVRFTVTGANTSVHESITDANGVATFTYTGINAGSDQVVATASPGGTALQSNLVNLTWTSGPHSTFIGLNQSPAAGAVNLPITLAGTLVDISVSPPSGLKGQTVSFSLAGQNCTAVTDSSGNASCSITPDVPSGTYSLTASFAGNSSFISTSSSKRIDLSAGGAVGIAPVNAALTIRPPALNFPTEVVLGINGNKSPARVVTLLNPKNASQDLPITIESLEPTDPSFIVAQNCLGALKPGSQCKVTMNFQPDSPGVHYGWLVVGSNAVNGEEEVAVRGVGRQGEISYTPHVLNFGRTTPDSAPAKFVTLRNPNPVAMSIMGIQSTGPYTASTNCVGTLPPHGTCKITVTFNAPATTGKQLGALTITDDAIKSPQTVKLTGVVK